MKNIFLPSKKQIDEQQRKDNQHAIKLVSKYFSQVTPKNYKYKHETFIKYEMISKNYAMLEVEQTHKNKLNKLSLIRLIKEL